MNSHVNTSNRSRSQRSDPFQLAIQFKEDGSCPSALMSQLNSGVRKLAIKKTVRLFHEEVNGDLDAEIRSVQNMPNIFKKVGEKCTELRELSVKGFVHFKDVCLELCASDKLTHVRLCCVSVTDAGVSAFLKRCPRLLSINLEKCFVGPLTYAQVAACGPRLELLVDCCYARKAEPLEEIVKKCTHLVTLYWKTPLRFAVVC